MSRTKTLITGLTVVGLGLAVYWRLSVSASRPVVRARLENVAATSLPAGARRSVEPVPSAPTATPPGAPDWEKRLQQIANLAGRVEQAELDVAIEDLARDLPDEEIVVALNLQLLPDADRMPVINSLNSALMKRWSERAPAEAAAWLARLPAGAFSLGAHRQVAMAWASKDLAATVAWLQQLPESDNKAAAQFVVSYEAAQRKEPATALTLASSLPPSPQRDQLMNYSVLQWATLDRDKAVAWASQVQNPALREEMLGKIAIEWGIQDPPRAADFAAGTLANGGGQEKSLVNIVRCWGSSAPEQAGAWVEKIPDGNLRAAVSQSLVEVWARNDLAKAGDWLSRLPIGRSRDAAVGTYATVLAINFPERAAQAAKTIQDESLRASVMTRLHGK